MPETPDQGPLAPIRAEGVVLENHDQGGGNFRITLEVPGWPGAEPGQFLMLSAGALSDVLRTDPLLPRPMAVFCGAGEGDRVEVLYKVHGRGTALMGEARPGERLRVVGPLGHGFPTPEGGERAILVGGGTGVASLYELARRAGGTELHLILGARTIGDLMGRSEFEALGAPLQITTEDGSRGLKGRVTDALGPLLEQPSDASRTRVYVCGPTPMMRACAALCERAAADCLVSLENNMACGFGVCLGCAAPLSEGGFDLVCRAGPVFPAESIAWEGLP